VRDERIRKTIERPSLRDNENAYPHGVFEHPNTFKKGRVYFPSANSFQQSNARQKKFDNLDFKYGASFVTSDNLNDVPEMNGLKMNSERRTLSSKRRLEFYPT
jgi:hypothetical protein